jgi:drug/metabolite transporter superfamily protein YnfA
MIYADARAEPVPGLGNDDSPFLSQGGDARTISAVRLVHTLVPARQAFRHRFLGGRRKSHSLREILSLFGRLAPPPLIRPIGLINAAFATYMQFLPWIAFALAAVFEVGGDAVIRLGIKNNNVILIFLGAGTLAGYGLIVNSIDWNFSKIFGVYVGAFALVAILFGKFLFREQIPLSTWIGLAIIISGGMVIQFGR